MIGAIIFYVEMKLLQVCWLATKGDLQSHRPLPPSYHIYILYPDHPSHSPSLAIRMTFEGYILSCGKKGLKAQGVKAAGKR
jgi:hypothetical protein